MSSILDGRPGLAAVIDQVAEVTGYLWQKGWAERNGGNITVTNISKDDLKQAEDMRDVLLMMIVQVIKQRKKEYEQSHDEKI